MKKIIACVVSCILAHSFLLGEELGVGGSRVSPVAIAEHIVFALESGASLSVEQERFLRPKTMEDSQSFFIEMNRCSSLVMRLLEAVENSELDAEIKESFRVRVLAESKDTAWNEILLNRLELPILLPSKRGQASGISEENFIKLKEEIKTHLEAYRQELRSGKALELLLSLQGKYYPRLVAIMRTPINVSEERQKLLSADFFEEVFEPGFEVQALERALPPATRNRLIKNAKPFFGEIRKIDSPLKDYVYLRFYEKMRKDRQ
ncbi:MAG: hypothetical protein J6L64_00975 [Opitutales bacterium]|nr:hypothetical protein [Opitutales bacterium]